MSRWSAILLVDPRGWLLLQERDEGAPIDPDCWGLVGGGVDPGEGFEAAAYRELSEETGVVAAPGTLAKWGEFTVAHRQGPSSGGRMQVFVARTDLTDADIVCGEGRQIVFVAPEEARGLPMSGAAAGIVPVFLDSEVYAGLTTGG
jgi:8-oxo-dGTP diphosphatase